MTDPTIEPVDLVAALGKAEADLGAATLIARTGRDADVVQALPEIKQARGNLESALQAFLAAAYTGKFAHLGPLDAAQATETRVKARLAQVDELIARHDKGMTTPASADKPTAKRDLDRIKGKEG